MSGHREDGWPDFVVAAAAEARRESDRYWAGAGSKYPKHKNSGWYAPLPREVRQQPPEAPRGETDIGKLVAAAKRRLGKR